MNPNGWPTEQTDSLGTDSIQQDSRIVSPDDIATRGKFV